MYWMPITLWSVLKLEVVLPALGAVLGVVVGDRRRAGGPAEPVVEAAEAGEEAERSGDQRHDDVRVAGLFGLVDAAGRRSRAGAITRPKPKAAASERAERASIPAGLLDRRRHLASRLHYAPPVRFRRRSASSVSVSCLTRVPVSGSPGPSVPARRPISSELRRRLDDDFGPHRGVAEAAELGADQLVGADLVRGDDRVGRDPGHVVFLDPPLGHPEGVDDVLGVHFEVDLAVDRDVEFAFGPG